jgi:hypothetical protein
MAGIVAQCGVVVDRSLEWLSAGNVFRRISIGEERAGMRQRREVKLCGVNC